VSITIAIGARNSHNHVLEYDMEMNVSKLTGLALATAVAGLFTMASVSTAFAADEAHMKCDKSSSCKGQGACKQASNSCKGQNACKGQGFTMQKDEAACKDAQAKAK
jgi:hypothetical protein